MQLGKIAPIVGYFRDVHAYSLTVIGWLTALIGVFVALAALPTARLIDRIGSVRALKTGAIILTFGALLLAFVDTLPFHLMARTIEAVGYVLLVIAAPAYLATHALPQQRPTLLALWGSFVPVGYALANIQAGLVTGAFGAAASLPSAAILLAAVTAATVGWVRASGVKMATDHRQDHDVERADATGSLRNAVLLAIAFGIYVVLQMGFFTFLPTFMETATRPLSPAVIALFVPAGNLIAALLLAILPAGSAGRLAALAMALSALSAVFLFQQSRAPELAPYVAFSFLGGVIASSVFASVPLATSARLSAAMVVGFIAQGGGIGTIGGPPLAGFLLDNFGWSALTWLLVVLSGLGALALVPTLMIAQARSQRS